MPDTLDLLLERTNTRLSGFESHVDALPQGRGGEWKALLSHALNECRVDVATAVADVTTSAARGEPFASEMRARVIQHLERVQYLLDGLHLRMATYREAVARADVPVGLQHLIDVLMEDIVIGSGDPIIHLNELNMYSTIDLTGPINEIITGLGPVASVYAGRPPIAFNLPALDPNNALLAPVLAHEVAHTAVNERLLADLEARVSTAPIGADIQDALAKFANVAGPEAAAQVSGLFQAWSKELLCDAVAVAVSGPSFLLAFTAFVTPPSASVGLSTHPPVHDRIRFALAMVEELGWLPFLQERVPGLLAWLQSVAADSYAHTGAHEALLQWATESTRDFRRDIAFDHIKSHLVPAGEETRLDRAAQWLAEGVPLIDIDTVALSPWQTVLAGWMAASLSHGDSPVTIARAAGDRDFNAVIVKALEYSQIVTAWRTT